jgi:hypothetical protein
MPNGRRVLPTKSLDKFAIVQVKEASVLDRGGEVRASTRKTQPADFSRSEMPKSSRRRMFDKS